MVGDYVGETLIVERSNLEKTFWLTFRLHSEIIDVRGEPSVSVSVALPNRKQAGLCPSSRGRLF